MIVNSYVNVFQNLLGPINFQKLESLADFYFRALTSRLTDTGEDSKLVDRRKRSKVDTLSSSFLPTRPSDEYGSAPSR